MSEKPTMHLWVEHRSAGTESRICSYRDGATNATEWDNYADVEETLPAVKAMFVLSGITVFEFEPNETEKPRTKLLISFDHIAKSLGLYLFTIERYVIHSEGQCVASASNIRHIDIGTVFRFVVDRMRVGDSASFEIGRFGRGVFHGTLTIEKMRDSNKFKYLNCTMSETLMDSLNTVGVSVYA